MGEVRLRNGTAVMGTFEPRSLSTFLIDPAELDFVWDRAAVMLLSARDHWDNFLTLDDIYTKVRSDEFQLWIFTIEGTDIIQFVVLTSLHTRLRTKQFSIRLIVGTDFKEFQDKILFSLESWAAYKGADEMEVIGRKGWLKQLAANDYKLDKVVLCKPLTRTQEH